MPSQIGKPISEEELNTFDPILKQKIKELMVEGTVAKEQEDFDRVVALRDAVLQLKDVGRNLIKYQDMKKLAIENEDYEVAKRLKIQIETEHQKIQQGYGIDSKTGKRYEESATYQPMQVPVLEKSIEDLSQSIDMQQNFPKSNLPLDSFK